MGMMMMRMMIMDDNPKRMTVCVLLLVAACTAHAACTLARNARYYQCILMIPDRKKTYTHMNVCSSPLLYHEVHMTVCSMLHALRAVNAHARVRTRGKAWSDKVEEDR